MFAKKVPFYYLFVCVFLSFSLAFTVIRFVSFTHDTPIITEATPMPPSNCEYRFQRIDGYQFIRPLVKATPVCESAKYQSLKSEILKLVEDYKNQGVITTSSVYFRDFKQADWICVNDAEKYLPGSLMKVPELITYLRMNEEFPGTLDKKILYDKPLKSVKSIAFSSNSIEVGKSYTIRELLKYMIVYSDNSATMLLNQHINLDIFKKTFVDLGLRTPDWKALDYPVTIKEISVFMEALYNSSYLSLDDSEFATSLLSKCNFKEGMLKGLPESIKVAHKFGEAGNDVSHELHETALIYVNETPFLLTVMTKGGDLSKLPSFISAVTKTVYDRVRAGI